MSYDLYFWRELTPQAPSPKTICEQLVQGEEPDGLAYLSVASIKQRFGAAFPQIQDEGTQLECEVSGSYFQVTWPVSSKPAKTSGIFVNCGYKLLKSPDTMNRIISVANDFGCALFDPQTGERYQQPDPTTA